MPRKVRDLRGQRFGRLVVTEFLGRRGHSSDWLCVCDCGVEKAIQSTALKLGSTKSCGCYRSDRMSKLTLKHGERGGEARLRRGGEYRTWENMKARCCNSDDPHYDGYGGRGISVAPEWLDDFARFLADVGRKPSPAHSLDRRDVNGNYEPGNVRWATATEQQRNRRNTVMVTVAGERVSLHAAAESAGLAAATLKKRLKLGWPIEDALSRPIIANKSSRLRA